MTLNLVKENIEHIKCAKEVENILVRAGLSIRDSKKDAKMCQYEIFSVDKQCGYLRFWQKADGSTTIDTSQIKIGSIKEKVERLLDGYLELEAFQKGDLPLNSRYLNDTILIKKVKNALLENFTKIQDLNQNDMIFEYKLTGPNLIISQYKTGSLQYQGKPTKFSDKVIRFVDNILIENQRQYTLEKIKEQIPKEDYEDIKEQLAKESVNLESYVSKDLFAFLSGCGVYFLHDGLLILKIIKEKNIKLKDYGSIIRNFAILFEDFLINWLVSLGILNEERFKKGTKAGYVGDILNGNPNKIEQNFGYLYTRIRPKFLEKLKSSYQEGRHDLLHADKYKYSPLNNQQAEARLNMILECMEDCVSLFKEPLAKIASSSKNSKIIGTDECGKGDYFGPLVVAGVFIGDSETEIKLIGLGVKDSKKISDEKINKLAVQISKLCKYNVVVINPERYNQLYEDIKNLNKLLGWGHARVIENMLQMVNPDYIISDKFGDESFIKSKLMEKGKSVTLIQEIRAEQNTAVAAASILARATFLDSLKKLSKQYSLIIPKGSGENVVEIGKQIIAEVGNDILNKIAKMHFRITDKIDNVKRKVRV